MKIFLSYASEQRVIAEEIDLKLTIDEHDVFFDKSTLAPGLEYHKTIHKYITKCELFIFLISPDSIADEHYTRTELLIAKQKWRNPSGKILPVMVKPTLIPQVDPYLQAVTILFPKGNIAAEVAAAVLRIQSNLSTNPLPGTLSSEVQQERIEAYKHLWENTKVLPKWPRPKDISYEILFKLTSDLRDWYFSGGGLFLSHNAHGHYSALQAGLTVILFENPVGPMSEVHYDAIRELCSALRNQLAADIGTRATSHSQDKL